MNTAHAEAELLDLIYAAAMDTELWGEVLDRMVLLIGGTLGVHSRLDIRNGAGWARVAHVDPGILESYFAHFYRINPIQIVEDPATYKKGWTPKILLDEDWMARPSLEHSEYYNDFLRPIEAEWSMIVRLGLKGDDISAFSIARPFRSGRYEPEEVAIAQRLQPHLVRAQRFSEQLESLKGLGAGLAAALDHSAHAMLLLDDAGRILHLNGEGERLLARGDAVRQVSGRLAAASPAQAQAFDALLARASAPDWTRRSGGAMTLRQAGSPAPLFASVSPMRFEQAQAFARGPSVLVCLSAHASVAGAPPERRLADLYALTPAETRVALALLEGLTLQQASSRFDTSVNTIRVQLASLFAKTGAHRQADLVRLLIGVCGPIEPARSRF